MKNDESKKVEEVVRLRNKYTSEEKAKARKYYLMGLNLQEISLLLNGCPVRTLEKWQLLDKWTDLKEPENLKVKTLELHGSGKSYKEIAEILNVSRATVWRYIKEARKSQTA